MTKFQIIIIEGEYNDKKFREKFLSLNQLEICNHSLPQEHTSIFDKYCLQIKKKLNTRYRETLLDSEILWTEKDDFLNCLQEEPKNPIEEIQIFFENFSTETNSENFNLIKQIGGLKYTQKIKNRWDERGDGRPDIEYDEITYFRGIITIYFFDNKI